MAVCVIVCVCVCVWGEEGGMCKVIGGQDGTHFVGLFVICSAGRRGQGDTHSMWLLLHPRILPVADL